MNALSYQNNHPKIIVSNRGRTSTAAEQNVNVRKRSDSYEFDLHELYHNAVECLIDCDRTIKSLREQVSLKDETIASFEERIVQMSLKLASTKAMQDEQSHQLHRIKRSINSLDGNAEDCDPIAWPTSKNRHVTSPSGGMTVDYFPVSVARKNREARDDPQSTLRDSSVVQKASIPEAVQNENNRQRCTFRMPSIRATQNIGRTQILTDSKKSKIGDMITVIDSDARVINNDGIVRQSASETTFAAVQRNSPNKGRRRHCSWKESMDDSASRRLSNIGNFLLGLNRNENTKDETICENVISKRQEDDVHMSRRDSLQFSIEGVVFPVSSNEVLAGCWDENQAATFDDSARRISSYSNEEWPEF